MKIFFMVVPKLAYQEYGIVNIDNHFFEHVRNFPANTVPKEQSEDCMIETFLERLKNKEFGQSVHTCNPTLINFLTDEYAMNHVMYFHENKAYFLNDGPLAAKYIEKNKFMGPGELVSDSVEFWEEVSPNLLQKR